MFMQNAVSKPRNGVLYQALASVRISGCQNQREVSNEDQAEHCRQFLHYLTGGAGLDLNVIACIGKGELLVREELADIERELRTRRYDFFINEDLGRLVRGETAKTLFGIAVDHGTRAISIHDDIDTIHDNWEERALEACADHIGHNRHVSRRIKQKSLNRFRMRGELFQMPIAGYERWKHDGLCDMRKIEGCAEIIAKGAAMLLEHIEEGKAS